MKNIVLIATVLLAPLAVSAADATSDPAPGSAAFSRLKALAGEWKADTPMGKAHLNIELVSAGTAILERESIGDMPPMVTLYHLDGNHLLLTHYCMVGNQPRMQAQAFDPATGELKFGFLDATNMASPNVPHMHSARFRFIDNDHFKSAWDFYEEGKLKETHAAEYSRVR